MEAADRSDVRQLPHPIYPRDDDELEKLKPYLVPALVVDHKLFVGRRGQDHSDINCPQYDSATNRSRGFYDPRTRTFYDAAELDIESPALMTKLQIHKKYAEHPGMLAIWGDEKPYQKAMKGYLGGKPIRK